MRGADGGLWWLLGTEPNLSASLDPLHLLFLTASHRISCPVSWPQVAFLMGMQHDRVVTFIGAGEMPHPSDPQHSDLVHSDGVHVGGLAELSAVG